ncbi:unnamed protein product [Adineta ricciae]|uniref:RNA-binding protein 42 n=1 Tax=Adineta ricciae TaxID=249248 RepID=A0A816DX05_ADIRI|nr:unnamed protein product [Adineta ricciae]
MSMSNFDAEMSRFENEISNVNAINAPPRMPLMPPVPPPPGMFPPMMPGIPPLPPPPPNVMAQLMNNNVPLPPPPARLPPRPAFVPHQLRHRVPQQSVPFPSTRTQQMPPQHPSPPSLVANSQNSNPPQQQSILSAQPLLYKTQTPNDKPASSIESTNPVSQRPAVQTPVVENKLATAPKFDQPGVAKLEQHPHPVSKAYASSSQAMDTRDHEGESSSSKKKNKAKPPKKIRNVRMAGGTTWEDETLAEWDPDDFRLFCGDLGNEVNDDVLIRAFNKYPSFQKAKVVRDKRSGKSRGYGFVSFKDSQDYIRAMREMNGKYVGNRPIKLRKSTWQERNIDVVKKKMKDKIKMGLR